jgi:hypothetical protein
MLELNTVKHVHYLAVFNKNKAWDALHSILDRKLPTPIHVDLFKVKSILIHQLTNNRF